MADTPPPAVQALAEICIQRAAVELTLRNQQPPITRDEFHYFYALIAVGIKRIKQPTNVDKLLAQRFFDNLVDNSLLPFLFLNTSAKEAAAQIRYKVGPFYTVSGLSRVSRSRRAYLQKLALATSETITNATAVLTGIRDLPADVLQRLFRNAQACILADETVEDDVRRLSLVFLEGVEGVWL